LRTAFSVAEKRQVEMLYRVRIAEALRSVLGGHEQRGKPPARVQAVAAEPVTPGIFIELARQIRQERVFVNAHDPQKARNQPSSCDTSA
jgi:hypothetical protein